VTSHDTGDISASASVTSSTTAKVLLDRPLAALRQVLRRRMVAGERRNMPQSTCPASR
jgi:hypothetical protein